MTRFKEWDADKLFYYISKIIWVFLTPSNLIFIGILLGSGLYLANACIWRRVGGVIAWTSFALLFLCGMGPMGSWLALPLEGRFPAFSEADGPKPSGILVLGGAVTSRTSLTAPEMMELNEAGERITAMLALARRYPAAKIMFSGGRGELFDLGLPEADEVRERIGALGLDPARILFENRSRNTYENAIYSHELAQPKPGERWLLVTSAWHMPRAVGCFRQAGFAVEAYPVDFRTNGARGLWQLNASISAGLHLTDIIVKEWIGLIAYWLAGKTDAWFPG